MKAFLRYLLPITYFQATRLNRWALVGYNGLVEWIPALALSIYFNQYDLAVVPKVLLSYLAFICIYEIGYITNDFYSERYEEDPRGRSDQLGESSSVVVGLIAMRLLVFAAVTIVLGASANIYWWTFHATLAATFALHNLLPNELRVPTFFGLSTYRFFGPLILTLQPQALLVLLPAVMLNNSVYRTTVYIRNKRDAKQQSPTVNFKFAFYAACLPLSVFLSVVSGSGLAVAICFYFVFVWLMYVTVARFAPSWTA